MKAFTTVQAMVISGWWALERLFYFIFYDLLFHLNFHRIYELYLWSEENWDDYQRASEMHPCVN